MPFQKGRALSKGARSPKRGAPFPFCHTVSQELRMDGGISKPGTACRNCMRTHTHSVAPVSCMSSSKLRHWRGCVVVDRSPQAQVPGAHLLLQQQVLGALPFPQERNWKRLLSYSEYSLPTVPCPPSLSEAAVTHDSCMSSSSPHHCWSFRDSLPTFPCPPSLSEAAVTPDSCMSSSSPRHCWSFRVFPVHLFPK